MPEFGKMLKDMIVNQQESGRSRPYLHPGHGWGRFDFDVEPWENELGAFMQRFIGKEWEGDLPLETEYQGSRWEDAPHAREDWKRYSQMDRHEQVSKMKAMWGEGQLAHTLYGLLRSGASFEKMRASIQNFDTWRSISAGEPE